MVYIANLRLLTKIILPISVLVVVLCGIVALAVHSLSTLSDLTHDVIDVSAVRKSAMLELKTAINEATIQEKNMILDADPASAAVYQRNLDAAAANAYAAADRLLALADTDARRAFNKSLREKLGSYEASMRRSSALGMAGKTEEAKAVSTGEGRKARLELTTLVEERQKIVDQELAKAGADASERAIEVRDTLLSVAAVSLVLVLSGLVWMVVAMVSRPIARVTTALEALSNGNLDITVEGSDRRDEVGALARALAVFRDGAREQRRLAAETEIENAAKMRRAEALVRLTGGFETTVRTLTGALTGAASNLESTATAMTSVAERTNQRSSMAAAASQQTSANVQTVAAATEELSASVKEIATQVHASRSITDQAVESARLAETRVRGLADGAERIGAIVDLINTIAGQTNLLALNATIEAARAGEAGRGFAVVAAEVKQLADQTARATGEIGTQIAAIRSATNEVVGAIEAFGVIVGRVSETSTVIAAAIEEQDSATAEISRNTQEAARGTEEVTTGVGAVREDAGATGKAAGDVLGAARGLARHSAELESAVENFLTGVRAA